MQHMISPQALRKTDQARFRQEAYVKRARVAAKWGRRCFYVTALAVLAVAWQDPTLGPMMQQATADAIHTVDVSLGGDGNAREVVLAALSDIRS